MRVEVLGRMQRHVERAHANLANLASALGNIGRAVAVHEATVAIPVVTGSHKPRKLRQVSQRLVFETITELGFPTVMAWWLSDNGLWWAGEAVLRGDNDWALVQPLLEVFERLVSSRQAEEASAREVFSDLRPIQKNLDRSRRDRVFLQEDVLDATFGKG